MVSVMGRYKPGDNYCICDLTGKKVLMSQTRKTWDGLRVWKGVWYPRHPQLDIRAIPDHMAVPDARPRTVDTYAPCYGLGAFCLRSLGSISYIYYVVDDGALMV